MFFAPYHFLSEIANMSEFILILIPPQVCPTLAKIFRAQQLSSHAQSASGSGMCIPIQLAFLAQIPTTLKSNNKC